MPKIEFPSESDNSLKQPRTYQERLELAFPMLCEARALAYSQGEVSLPDAVDYLQDWAVSRGLVDLIGQDAVQWVMAKAFLPYREEDWA